MEHNQSPSQGNGPTPWDDPFLQRFTYPELGESLNLNLNPNPNLAPGPDPGRGCPEGYRPLHCAGLIGTGRAAFDAAADALLHWDVHRGAGLRVDLGPCDDAAAHAGDPVGEDTIAVLGYRLGPFTLRAPVRVVVLVDEADRRGFVYGTLPGHPECGEESLLVRIDPAAGDAVHFEAAAFSRPALWWSRLGGPLTRVVQRRITERYLRAARERAAAAPGH